MKYAYVAILIILASILSYSTLASEALPNGWVKAGSNTKDYKMGIDSNKGYLGTHSAYIESITSKPSGFSTMMQNANLDIYKGKRVQMTVYISTENISLWTGAWLRIDKNGQSVSFDNMNNRGIVGTTNWKQYSIVLDVPEDATNMAFGVLLVGEGKVWFDKFDFNIVDNSVPVTDLDSKSEAPKNLSFEN